MSYVLPHLSSYHLKTISMKIYVIYHSTYISNVLCTGDTKDSVSNISFLDDAHVCLMCGALSGSVWTIDRRDNSQSRKLYQTSPDPNMVNIHNVVRCISSLNFRSKVMKLSRSRCVNNYFDKLLKHPTIKPWKYKIFNLVAII